MFGSCCFDFLVFCLALFFFFFFFNDTATTEIYTLSLHDALPISRAARRGAPVVRLVRIQCGIRARRERARRPDRKSTRLNSSHGYISYAVFCLKKKKITTRPHHRTQRVTQQFFDELRRVPADTDN